MPFDEDLIEALAQFGHTTTFPPDEIDAPAAFQRDAEVGLLSHHLNHARHNSLIVVGPSGCGKSAVLRELFRRAARLDDAVDVQPWLVLETSTSQMMAGTSYIGEWQTRFQELIELARREDRVAVYFTDMYINWANLKGFKTTLVHEDLLDKKTTREITVMIEGVAIYGMLRGEEGIHEMHYARTSKTPRQSKYIKVRVLPIIENDSTPSPSEVICESKRSRGSGLRIKQYKSTVNATHDPTGVALTARSGLPPSEAADQVADLAAAEALRITHRRTSTSEENAGPPVHPTHEEAVRRYTLRPQQSVKDARTGLSTNNLQELWKGALDEFLYAAVMARNQED